MKDCKHEKAGVKRYVGSTDTYNFCPSCFHTWGGEETSAKKALIAAAAGAPVSEADEVDGSIPARAVVVT